MTTTGISERGSDGGLMTRVADGDVRAFEVVYDRYRGLAFGLALRLTRHPAAAEDVTQEAFLNLWRSAARYEPSRGSLKSWLLQIVHNRGIDALRRGTRHQRDVGLEDLRAEKLQAPELTETTVVKQDESHHLRRLLTDLPSKQREVIELAYFKELSHAEMAHNLGVPLGTVKGRVRLAHEKLHGRLMFLDSSSVGRDRSAGLDAVGALQ